MEMKVLNTQKKLCCSCMEEHDVKTVTIKETNQFKDINLEYDAVYFYCDQTDELFSDEQMMSANDIAMKNAYRIHQGLLTSSEITAIRQKFNITQSDLCLLLGWGAKTVTRYESHQVQDIAHDTILRKINDDPEWFISLLEKSKDQIEESAYRKYLTAASQIYAADYDSYLKRALRAKSLMDADL